MKVILIFMNLNMKENIALKMNVLRVGFSGESYKQLAKSTHFSLDSHI